MYHNHDGRFGLFYFGYDVYTISDLDSWSSAYIAEAVLYGMVVVWKVLFERKGSRRTATAPAGTVVGKLD